MEPKENPSNRMVASPCSTLNVEPESSPICRDTARCARIRCEAAYPSALSRHHQIQLGFIPIRDHFQAQWPEDDPKPLFGGKRLNKQVAGGPQLINEGPAFGMADHKPS